METSFLISISSNCSSSNSDIWSLAILSSNFNESSLFDKSSVDIFISSFGKSSSLSELKLISIIWFSSVIIFDVLVSIWTSLSFKATESDPRLKLSWDPFKVVRTISEDIINIINKLDINLWIGGHNNVNFAASFCLDKALEDLPNYKNISWLIQPLFALL